MSYSPLPITGGDELMTSDHFIRQFNTISRAPYANRRRFKTHYYGMLYVCLATVTRIKQKQLLHRMAVDLLVTLWEHRSELLTPSSGVIIYNKILEKSIQVTEFYSDWAMRVNKQLLAMQTELVAINEAYGLASTVQPQK